MGAAPRCNGLSALCSVSRFVFVCVFFLIHFLFFSISNACVLVEVCLKTHFIAVVISTY